MYKTPVKYHVNGWNRLDMIPPPSNSLIVVECLSGLVVKINSSLIPEHDFNSIPPCLWKLTGIAKHQLGLWS